MDMLLDHLRIIFGIFVDVLPSACLCYVPFTNRLAISKGYFFVILTLAMLCTGILAVIYVNSPLNTNVLWGICSVLMLFFFFIIYMLTVKVHIHKLLFVFIIVCSYVYNMASISHFIQARMYPAPFSILYSVPESMIKLLMLLLVTPFFIWFLRKHVRPVIGFSDIPSWRILWLIPTTFLSLTVISTGSFLIDTISQWQYLVTHLIMMAGSFLAYFVVLYMVRQTHENTQLTDLTDRLAVQNEKLQEMTLSLENEKKSRDTLFQNISHDFRTPIAVIRGAADILSESDLYLSDIKVLGRIISRTAQLEKMVEDVIDLNNLSTGELKFKHDLVDIPALFDTFYGEYNSLCQKQGISFSISPFVGTLLTDKQRIIQVFDNLISNALFHTRVGEICLTARQEAGFCIFSVADMGNGILEKDLPHVFDRLYCGESRKKSGSGLGLSICKSIVEQLGGEIWVESKFGEGAVFSFSVKMTPNGVEKDKDAI